MFELDFKKTIHVYFVGIGGISMSGLAEVLLSEGFRISGSDMKASPLTDKLASMGASVYYDQTVSHIDESVDLVVFTAAIHEDNPEYIAMKELGIPSLTRAELLGQLMRNYKIPIAVSGTHGKTTTTSMVAEVLLASDTDPTLSIGGILKSIEGNIRVGKSPYFVTEACEYTNSFLSFYPTLSIILIIEEDHMDFFKDLDDIMNSFRLFAQRLPKDGTLVINKEIKDYEKVTEGLECDVITYGMDDSCTYHAKNVLFNKQGYGEFDVIYDGESLGHIVLSVPGNHNVSNALAVIAASRKLGISMDVIQAGLLGFRGANRRFQYKGTLNGVTIIDDYAHHPTEIHTTLGAAQNYPHREVWCVFQPHTYTRTKAFFEDFAKSLSLADHIVLADIYAARETDTLGMSSELLCEEIKKLGADCHYFPSFVEIQEFLKSHCIHGDLLITMGAGDVVNIGENLLKA